MQVKFNCPYCHAKIGAQDEYCGMSVQCPGCDQNMTVPSPKMGSGAMMGGYRIDQFLGAGAMGEVYLATQMSMDRQVALKIISEDMADDEEERQRFSREIRLLAKLNHQNIVTAFEAGEADGQQFLAMGFVDGVALDERLDRDGKIPEKEALDISLKVANALKYAWERFEMLHRDVKPANVMIDKYGEVKLMDMGIAKTRSEEASTTMAGMVLGTPFYMSPEQARASADLDFRSDLYGLGAMLFHLVTGKYSHDGANPMDVLTKKISTPAPKAREINPEVSAACEELLALMLATEPDERPESWDACIEKMRRVRAGKSPVRKTSAGGSAKKRKLRMNATAPVIGKDELGDLDEEENDRLDSAGRKGNKAVVLGAVAACIVAALAVWAMASDDQEIDDGGGSEVVEVIPEPADEPPEEVTGSNSNQEDAAAAAEKKRKLRKRKAAAAALLEKADGYYESNPYNFVEAMGHFQRAVSVGKGLPIATEAYSRVEAVREARSRAVEHLVAYLGAQMLPLVEAGQYEAAAGRVMAYRGRLESETHSSRESLAGAILDEERREDGLEALRRLAGSYRDKFASRPPKLLTSSEDTAGNDDASTSTPAVTRPVDPPTMSEPHAVGDAAVVQLADKFAELLVRREFEQARREALTLQQKLGSDQSGAVAKLVARVLEVTAMQDRLLDGLRKDLGNTVTLRLGPKGEQLKIVLEEVRPTGLRGYEKVKVAGGSEGKLGRRVKLSELSTVEVLWRLQESGTKELLAMRGLLAIDLGRHDVADQSFGSAGGVLGKALQRALRPLSAGLREKDASDALAQLLHEVGVSTESELATILRELALPDKSVSEALAEKLNLPARSQDDLAAIRGRVERFREAHKSTKLVSEQAELLDALAKLRKQTWPLAPEKVTFIYDPDKPDESGTLSTWGTVFSRPGRGLWIGEDGGVMIERVGQPLNLFGNGGFTIEFAAMAKYSEGDAQLLSIEDAERRKLGLYQSGRSLTLEYWSEGEMRTTSFGRLGKRGGHVSLAYDPTAGQIRGAIDGEFVLTADVALDLADLDASRVIFGATKIGERSWHGRFGFILIYGAAQIPGNFGRHYEAAAAKIESSRDERE